MPRGLQAVVREPYAIYFCSGRARALWSSTAISNDNRAACAAPLQENDYFGFKVGGIWAPPTAG